MEAPAHGVFPRPFGKYELLERIGDGGMAEVFKARLPGVAGFEKTVVIKRMLPQLLNRRHFVDMFVAEASLAAQVQHKNVVQVFELGQLESGELFIVMEYVQGTDLRHVLRAANGAGLRLPPWFSLYVIAEVLEGLTFAHQLVDASHRSRNIVHRDVTPSNIFISHLGEVKLGDFGVAHDDARASNTQAGQLKGKVPYMSPEQIYSRGLDRRTDVFAASVVLWECLTQRRLFAGGPDIDVMNRICKQERPAASRYAPDVVAELDAVLQEGLAIAPERRLDSAQALQARILDLLPIYAPTVRSDMVRRVVDVFLGRLSPEAAGVLRFETAWNLQPESSGGSKSFPARPFSTSSGGAARADLSQDLLLGAPPTSAPGARPAPDPRLAAALFQPVSSYLGTTPGPELELLEGVEPEDADTPIELDLATHAMEDLTAVLPPPVTDDALAQIEALVAEAVQDLGDVSPAVPVLLPESALLAGLDVRRHGAGVSDHANQKWASFGLLGQSYDGPFPFWLRDHEGELIGPCSWEQALGIVRSELEARISGESVISSDQASWITVAELAELSGMESLLRNHDQGQPGPGTIFGSMEQRSAVSLFGMLDAVSASGVLLIQEHGYRRHDFREVHVRDGAPVYVYANAPKLQLPELLVAKRLLPRTLIAELAHVMVRERRPLLEVATRYVGTDLAQYRGVLMKERLLDLFARNAATFSFDERQTPVALRPFARSLLQLLPELVHRAASMDQLRLYLVPFMDARLTTTFRFASGLERLSLPPAQLASATRLAQGRTLGELLAQAPEESKLHCTLAYVLLETELLVPR